MYRHVYDIDILPLLVKATLQARSRGTFARAGRHTLAPAPLAVCLREGNKPLLSQSCTSKGIGRQAIGSFCKEMLCFSTMPCRPMPLLVLFWLGSRWFRKPAHYPFSLPVLSSLMSVTVQGFDVNVGNPEIYAKLSICIDMLQTQSSERVVACFLYRCMIVLRYSVVVGCMLCYWWYVISRHVTSCHTTLRHATPRHVMHLCVMLCHGMACHVMPWYGNLIDDMLWRCMLSYGMLWHGTVYHLMSGFAVLWYGMVRNVMSCHVMAWYDVIWYAMSWHVTVCYVMFWYGMVC